MSKRSKGRDVPAPSTPEVANATPEATNNTVPEAASPPEADTTTVPEPVAPEATPAIMTGLIAAVLASIASSKRRVWGYLLGHDSQYRRGAGIRYTIRAIIVPAGAMEDGALGPGWFVGVYRSADGERHETQCQAIDRVAIEVDPVEAVSPQKGGQCQVFTGPGAGPCTLSLDGQGRHASLSVPPAPTVANSPPGGTYPIHLVIDTAGAVISASREVQEPVA